MSWGNRIEVRGMQAFDVTRGATFLGQSWLTNAYIRINTTNSASGWSGWPFSSTERYWQSWPIKVRSWVLFGRGGGGRGGSSGAGAGTGTSAWLWLRRPLW
jgi:hypothetical protein